MRAGRLARFRAGENHSDMVLGFVLEFQFLSLISTDCLACSLHPHLIAPNFSVSLFQLLRLCCMLQAEL